jgi:hypothetical protein
MLGSSYVASQFASSQEGLSSMSDAELEEMWKEAVVACFSYCCGIYFEGLSKSAEKNPN